MRALTALDPARAVSLKRASEPPTRSDGVRVLVDRHWPPGLSREQAAIDLWLRDAAPSAALQRWYGRDPLRRASFVDRYRAELARQDSLLSLLDGLCRRGRLTLVCAGGDAARTHAAVLRDVLIERFATRDPPPRQGVAKRGGGPDKPSRIESATS
jgi:uncharacterized protein YeaO (DUF488 family)